MPTNVTFPGNLGQTETIADLRDLPSTFIDPGTIYVVKGVGRAYSYDPGSLATDDGLNVIRPNDRTPLQAGRFLYEVDGIASGPKGDTGAANSTYVSLATLKAAPVANSSYIFSPPAGVDGGVAAGTFLYQTAGAPYTADGVNIIKLDDIALSVGALVRQADTGLVSRLNMDGGILRNLSDVNSDAISFNRFGAIGDNTFDNASRVQKAILEIAKRGGGELYFGEAPAQYFIGSPIYVPSNISINLNGQTLRTVYPQALFRSGRLVGGAIVPIGDVFDPFVTVINSRIFGGKIQDAGIAFEMRSWIRNCSISNIAFEGCRQGFVLYDCFYSLATDLTTAPPGTDFAYPFFHLARASNAMVFTRCTATAPNGWLIENGCTATTWIGCTVEGGGIGHKIKGECVGLAFIGGYYEALPGVCFDLTEAGACWITWSGNYFNYVDTVFDDGGMAQMGSLRGIFDASNKVVNVNGTSGGVLYRGLFKVTAPGNYIDFQGDGEPSTDLSPLSNWQTGKHTHKYRELLWNADGKVDIRAKAAVEDGIVPRAYSGDVGDPFPGTIPFCLVALPQGASVAATVTTQIPMRANASVVHFVVTFNDNAGPRKVSGTIYGDYVDQRQGADRPVTVSANGSGKLVLSIGSINNGNGAVVITGTVYLGK